MSSARLRRAVHFVPGGNERMLAKSLGLEADTLILDLEDAVTPDRKEEVRREVAGWLKATDFGSKERAVRVNDLMTPWGREDYEVTMEHPPDAYVVPKVSGVDDVLRVDRLVAQLELAHGHDLGGIALILIATETAGGALNLAHLTATTRVSALTWGAEDLSVSIGASRRRDERGEYLDVFRYCRAMTLLAARAGGAQPIDSVFTDIGDLDGLRRDCQRAAWMGFEGKMTIHPNQIPIVNEVFTPSKEEIASAAALVAAFAENQAQGRMAFRHEGQMVDAPHLHRAERVLDRARQAGAVK